jgi:hypothetical protein
MRSGFPNRMLGRQVRGTWTPVSTCSSRGHTSPTPVGLYTHDFEVRNGPLRCQCGYQLLFVFVVDAVGFGVRIDGQVPGLCSGPGSQCTFIVRPHYFDVHKSRLAWEYDIGWRIFSVDIMFGSVIRISQPEERSAITSYSQHFRLKMIDRAITHCSSQSDA